MTPFGFDLHVGGALVGLALLAVFGIGLGAFSYALAIAVRKQDWMFWVVQQTFLFPLMILSGMLLPLETGPGLDAGGVEVQPAVLRGRRRAGAVRRGRRSRVRRCGAGSPRSSPLRPAWRSAYG